MIAFVFGAISILLPFITMSTIYERRRQVKKRTWLNRWGMLTEELRSKNILQLYYFPLFMYQRLMIAGIIVYLYDTPLYQCLAVGICNMSMIYYLVKVRPFKSESQ